MKIHIQTKNKEESIQIPLALPLEQLGLLKINNKLKQNLEEKPMIAYRRNRNLKDIIGDTTNKNRILKEGYCKQCFSKMKNLAVN